MDSFDYSCFKISTLNINSQPTKLQTKKKQQNLYSLYQILACTGITLSFKPLRLYMLRESVLSKYYLPHNISIQAIFLQQM